MKYNADGVITFIRGDDDALIVALKNGVSFSEGDKVEFSLKPTAASRNDIFEIVVSDFMDYNDIPNSAALINIPHSATNDLELGNYFYDIHIAWANGTYVTVVTPTKFVLVAGGAPWNPA